MIVDKINQYLSQNEMSFNSYVQEEVATMAGWSFKRQFMETDDYDSTGKIHMSGIGKCTRQLAYKYHGFEQKGKQIDGRAKINFFYGDIAELVLIKVAKLAGVPLAGTGLDQVRITVPLNGSGEISGYSDGFYIGPEIMTVSVKSMPSFGFKDFEKGQIDDSYIAQANIEMYACGVEKCIFVSLCKNSGVFAEKARRIVAAQPQRGLRQIIGAKAEKFRRCTNSYLTRTKRLPKSPRRWK